MNRITIPFSNMKIQQRRRRIYYKQNVVQDPYGFVLATVAVICAALLVFILIWPKNNISTSLATRSLRSPAHSDMDSKDYIHQPGQMVKSKIRLPKSATRSGQRNVLKISVTPQTKVLKDSAKPQTSIFEDSIKPVTNIFKDSVKPQTSGTTKTIWMYWEQGLEHLNSLSTNPASEHFTDSRCVEAWVKLNPKWNVRVLSKDTIDEELAPLFCGIAKDEEMSKKVTISMQSDLLRLELLSRYGGVWADTSVCPFLELDSFITDWLGSGADGFFAPQLGLSNVRASDLPKDTASCHDKEIAGNAESFRTASSWFLASAGPHNPLIDEWLRIYHGHLIDLTNRSLPYYVMHCSLTQARMTSAVVNDIWLSSTERFDRYMKQGLLKKHPCFDMNSDKAKIDYYLENCVFVKRQISKHLRLYIPSRIYDLDIKQRWLSQFD